MEIESLRLRVTDADANAILSRHMPKDTGIEKVVVHFQPDGAMFRGVYPTMMMNVSFESKWTLTAQAGKVEAKLASLSVASFPAGKFKSLILKIMRDTMANQAGLTFGDEFVLVDLEEIMRDEGLSMLCNLMSIELGEGWMLIVAGKV